MNFYKTIGWVALLAWMGPVGADVPLAWDRPPEAELSTIAGYRLYISRASFQDSTGWKSIEAVKADDAIEQLELGQWTTYIYVGDRLGETLYFRLTAVGHNGAESGFNVDANGQDEEAIYRVPPGKPIRLRIDISIYRIE